MTDLKTVYQNIGKNIKKYREQMNFTQQDLADKTGLGINFIGKIEVAFSHPSIKSLTIISEALGIDLYKLFIAQ